MFVALDVLEDNTLAWTFWHLEIKIKTFATVPHVPLDVHSGTLWPGESRLNPFVQNDDKCLGRNWMLNLEN